MNFKDLLKTEIPDVSDAEMIEAFEPTLNKLYRIYQREGSESRLQPTYFAMLMSDVIKEKRASDYFAKALKEKRCSEKSETPNINVTILAFAK